MSNRLRSTNLVLLFSSLFLIGALLRTEPKPQAAVTYNAPSSINSSCTSEVTTQINNWLDTVPDGGTALFGSGKCYLINSTIQIVERNNLTIDGAGATFKITTDGTETSDALKRIHFLVYKSSNITIKRTIIQGPHLNAASTGQTYFASLEGQHGYAIHGSHNIVLDNIEVYKVYGDFVYIGRQGGSIPSNITIKNSKFDGSGRQGIAITAGNNITIEDNFVANASRATFDIEPNTSSWTVNNVDIRNNHVSVGKLLFVANAGACTEVKNISIVNNVLTGKAMNIWSFPPDNCNTRRGPFNISGNTSDSQYINGNSHVIRIKNADGVTMSGNTQPMVNHANMRLVRLESVTQASITNNILLGGKGSLIAANGTEDYCYSGNYIGSPLILEETLKTCDIPLPEEPDPEDNTPPPTVIEEDTEAIEESIKPSPNAAQVPEIRKPNTSTSQKQNQNGGTSDASEGSDIGLASYEGEDGYLVTTTRSGSILAGMWQNLKDIPVTVSEVFGNITSLPEILNSPRKRGALIMLVSLVVTISASVELIYLWRKHQKNRKIFNKHHNLGMLNHQQTPNTPVLPKEVEKNDTNSNDHDDTTTPGNIIKPT